MAREFARYTGSTFHEHLLEIIVNALIGRRHKAAGNALSPGASGTTNSVRVEIDCIGHVIIHDERHVGDIDTPSCNVRRHEHIIFVLLESVDRRLALLLRLSAVECCHVVALLLENAVEVVAVPLRVDKDNREISVALEAIERLEPSLDIEEEQPHVLHWQTKKPSVAREEFGGHGVGSTTKGKGGKCFKCQQVGHWAAECPN